VVLGSHSGRSVTNVRLTKCERAYPLKRMPDRRGARVTNALLASMVAEFARINANFREVDRQWPFQYGERQVEPFVFASFIHAGGTAFPQDPAITTRRSMEPRRGWVDLYVYHRRTVHLIEFKMRRASLVRSGFVRVRRTWCAGCEQIADRGVLAQDYAPNSVFKTALLVVPLFRENGERHKLARDEVDRTISQARRILATLRPAADWASLWTPCRKKHDQPVESSRGWARYPGILFAARVTGPVR
jgi:hypothetical protein